VVESANVRGGEKPTHLDRVRLRTLMFGVAIIAVECGAIRLSPPLGVYAALVMPSAVAFTVDAAKRETPRRGSPETGWLIGMFAVFSVIFAFLWLLAARVIGGPIVEQYYGW
jgi:hypothetical protein